MHGIVVLVMKKSIVQSHKQCTGWCVFAFAVLCAALAGCDVGPRYQPPTATAPQVYKESPTQFKEASEWTVAQPQDAVLRGKWWEIYNDPALNALEDQLNIDNQNIRQSFENFMQARAMVREARSQFFPTVGVGGFYTRSQSSSNVGSGSATSTSTTGGTQTQLFSLPADVSWEPDLWGRVRNTVRASQYTAQLTAADLENERLTEEASLAEYFFEIRGQDALQKLLNDTVEADKKALAIAKARYDSGVDDQISVVEAQSTLDSAQSAAINLGIARAQYEHAIATLIGKTASTFSIPVEPRTSAPPPIPVGLPSQLLERRPDIAAAERNMATANTQIRVAYAAFYPSLTLSASGGVESSAIKNLLEWPSRFWSVGPSISEAVYDGGLRRATVNQYIATYNADVAAYRQSVLIAFQQVEDSLAAVRILSQQIQRQQQAVDANQSFLKLELGRYESGIDPYIDVVTAQTTLLGSRQTLTNLEVEQMTASVQLIAALGGGWERSQLPTPTQVTKKPSKSETAIQH
ncbi:MAG: efflux transporter outer membrane subunit [Terracidiphilus sp.]